MSASPFVVNMAIPRLLGYFLNALLYGNLVIQTYLYYIAFPKDRTGIKVLVYGVFFLATVQTGLMCHDMLGSFGFGFADAQNLSTVQLSWFTVPILGSLISSVVQLFFAWRINALSGSATIATLVTLLSFVSLSTGIVQGVNSLRINDFSKLPIITAAVWLISAAVCDVIIAISMTWALRKKKNGAKDADAMITKFIRLTIETGTVTAIMASITAALRLVTANASQYFVLPSSVLGPLYANNLVVIFNSRIHIVGSRQYYANRGGSSSTALTHTSNIPTNEVVMSEFLDLSHRASDLIEINVLPAKSSNKDESDVSTDGLSPRWG